MDTTVVSAERTIGALFSAVTDALVAGEASIVITTPQMTATITKRKTGQCCTVPSVAYTVLLQSRWRIRSDTSHVCTFVPE